VRPIGAVAAPATVTISTAYTTGYTWFDNSPPGNAICCPSIHQAAGGTGTYADPITLAAGLVSSGVLDYARGTRFYMPDVRRYFIVEDSCGNVGSGGCHFLNNAPAGATTWVDRWVGGTAGDSQQAVQNCADYLTDENGSTPLHTILENPPAGLAVVPGPLFQNGQCAAVYGNGPPPPPTQPPTPPPTKPPTVPPTATPISHTPLPASTPLPPVAGAAVASGLAGTGDSAGAGNQEAPAPAIGQTSPPRGPSGTVVAAAAKANPLASYALVLFSTTALALLLAVGAIAYWLRRRRRSRDRDRGSAQ
jgi:hypothetical protein